MRMLYLVFACDRYMSAGDRDDCVGAYSSLSLAKQAASKVKLDIIKIFEVKTNMGDGSFKLVWSGSHGVEDPEPPPTPQEPSFSVVPELYIAGRKYPK